MEALEFPNKVCKLISCILEKLTALFPILLMVTAPSFKVVVKSPTELVTSPNKPGNLAAAKVPLTFVPDKLTALAVIA